jgi:zinc protease
MLATYPLAPPDAGLPVRRDAVQAVASRSLRPGTVVIGIGGGVTREDAQRELESATAAWRATSPGGDLAAGAGTVKATPERAKTVDEPGYTTWIAVGHPVPAIAAADEAAVAVMTDILNIRLTITIREIRGLANATQLQIPATTRHDGLLQVRSGARPESIAPIIRLSTEELTRIRESAGAPTADELAQVKGGQVLGKWQGSLDGARDASVTYASEAARFGSVDHLLKWPDVIRAVTAADVTRVAQKYVHPDMLGTVVIGQIDAVRAARHPRWPVAFDEVMPGAR